MCLCSSYCALLSPSFLIYKTGNNNSSLYKIWLGLNEKKALQNAQHRIVPQYLLSIIFSFQMQLSELSLSELQPLLRDESTS